MVLRLQGCGRSSISAAGKNRRASPERDLSSTIRGQDLADDRIAARPFPKLPETRGPSSNPPHLFRDRTAIRSPRPSAMHEIPHLRSACNRNNLATCIRPCGSSRREPCLHRAHREKDRKSVVKIRRMQFRRVRFRSALFQSCPKLGDLRRIRPTYFATERRFAVLDLQPCTKFRTCVQLAIETISRRVFGRADPLDESLVCIEPTAKKIGRAS